MSEPKVTPADYIDFLIASPVHVNAPVESFFGRMKCEIAGSEMFATKDQAKAEIFESLEVFYNRVRLHSSLGFVSPVAFERLRAYNQTHR